jgi:hypothetical protein
MAYVVVLVDKIDTSINAELGRHVVPLRTSLHHYCDCDSVSIIEELFREDATGCSAEI